MRAMFAIFLLMVMLICGSATIALMLYLFGVVGQ